MKYLNYLLLSILTLILLSACNNTSQSDLKTQVFEYSGKLVANKDRRQFDNLPLLKAYAARVKQSLLADPSILPIKQSQLNDAERLAQNIVFANKHFSQYSKHPQSKLPLRNEIMTIRKLLAADLDINNKTKVKPCEKHDCYRIEMYNFFFNMSIVAIVDIVDKKVLSINNYSATQPDLNQQLIQLAIEIAKNSELVQQELGTNFKTEPTMSEIKTALNNSRCERSHHLCVAPTFVVADRALWAIVDLTDGDLVGVRWTELGTSGPPIEVTERQLENEFVFSEFCEKSRHYQQGDWQFDYQITPSDGIELTDIKYQNNMVMKSAKLLDWHVSYSTREDFGYSDAIGCPLFSSAVVIAYEGPKVEDITIENQKEGFAFIQDFRQPPWPTPCNYRYEQRFEFYSDGRFRVAAADYGRGCGTDGTYRPVLRMDIEVAKDGNEIFSQYNGSIWQQWHEEQWHLQSEQTQYTKQGYLFKIANAQNQGFYIEPNRGQFNDGSLGDFAFSYISVKHADKDEGKNDMVTMGSCCNKDFRQGPEQFITPAESLEKKNLVLWYVPQIKNNGNAGEEYCWADTIVEYGIKKIKVWPCFAGPMFHPIK